eukprot:TRINITY_DN3313_c2_g1_i5.p1 TRINITY_DN3313_c2_g1~~TRINITY_DN3313_c2_g1_i5.p1  ORF type:complete len:396 (+),score=112.62 TRINITY_DN3313_c2_g1_i5:157-1188(+)
MAANATTSGSTAAAGSNSRWQRLKSQMQDSEQPDSDRQSSRSAATSKLLDQLRELRQAAAVSSSSSMSPKDEEQSPLAENQQQPRTENDSEAVVLEDLGGCAASLSSSTAASRQRNSGLYNSEEELRPQIELRCFLRKLGLEDIISLLRESLGYGQSCSLDGLLKLSDSELAQLKISPAKLQRLAKALETERFRQGLGFGNTASRIQQADFQPFRCMDQQRVSQQLVHEEARLQNEEQPHHQQSDYLSQQTQSWPQEPQRQAQPQPQPQLPQQPEKQQQQRPHQHDSQQQEHQKQQPISPIFATTCPSPQPQPSQTPPPPLPKTTAATAAAAATTATTRTEQH